MGLDKPPMAIPINIITSEILSNVESRNAPFLDVFLVIFATLPSITSKNPEINKMILPTNAALKKISFCMEFNPYAIDDVIASMKPIIVRVFGDNPDDAKIDAIFSRIGARFFLNLFNNRYLTNNFN